MQFFIIKPVFLFKSFLSTVKMKYLMPSYNFIMKAEKNWLSFKIRAPNLKKSHLQKTLEQRAFCIQPNFCQWSKWSNIQSRSE